MMGRNHVQTGLIAGLALAPVYGPDLRTQAGSVVLTAAMALAPDLDMTESTAARMWGPVTRGVRVRVFRRRRTIVPGLSHVVCLIAGGHRRGTHSILGLVLLLAAVLIAHWWLLLSAALAALAVGLGLQAADLLLGRGRQVHWQINLTLSVGAGIALHQAGQTLPLWTGWAMATGAAVHILGDMCTEQGCPLSWPTGRHRVSLLPMEAGGLTETYLVTPALTAILVWLAAWKANPDLPTPLTLMGGLW